ncbi:DUF58 domain-containing protein [Microbacterium sp. ASV49]|uniref:DUF58 domain-containing protein n=1 Tax=Microbacterium candidum TaxID=3041922 RepID=A0ABT7N2R1_9MICO|nr:DUF58 domain-containing protein [Microbacterium sp. ASV49]MDL9981003.1 DUF58 domain-containing protein [Microbacterium sp. ASV49]
MRRAWPLTGRGTGALVLAVACFIGAGQLGIIELVYFGVLLIAVVGAGFATLYLVRHSETVTRTLVPDIPSVGGELRVHVHMEVRSPLPSAAGSWRDALPRGLAGAAAGGLPAIGSGLAGGDRTVEFDYPLTATERGVYALGPLSVTTGDPFGLARRATTVGSTTRVTVAPAIVELPPLWDPAGEAGGTNLTTTSRLGQGADNLIARPYVSGDSMRRIHWRATAHRDTLMVRQEEQESTPQATVVLDRAAEVWGPGAAGRPGADPAFEVAVTAAVSTVARLVRDGYHVAIRDADGTELWDPIPGGDGDEVAAMATSFATLVAKLDDGRRTPADATAGLDFGTGPTVLITGQTGHPAMHVPVGSPGLLIGIGPDPDAFRDAQAAGWRVIPVPPGEDLLESWGVAHRRVGRVRA